MVTYPTECPGLAKSCHPKRSLLPWNSTRSDGAVAPERGFHGPTNRPPEEAQPRKPSEGFVAAVSMGAPELARSDSGPVAALLNRRVRSRTHGGMGGREVRPPSHPRVLRS